jgi:hypothetical protein
MCRTCEEEKPDRHFIMEEVRLLEITVNMKQAVAVVWTLIAIVLSLIITLGMGFPYSILGYGAYYAAVPWWMMIAAFFGVLLVITLPVYLLIVLWALVAKSEGE